MQCTERLYLTADGKKLVQEGHPAGSSLYAAPGDEIPQSAVELFGLVDGTVKGAKETPPPPNKERKPGPNKGGSKKAGSKRASAKKGGASAPPAPPTSPAPGAGGQAVFPGLSAEALGTLIEAGISNVTELAELDVENLPTIEGLPADFDLAAAVTAAKESTDQAAASGDKA